MNPRELSIDTQKILIQTFKNYFPKIGDTGDGKTEAMITWQHAAPLLAMIVTDRELAKTIKTNYKLLQDASTTLKNLNQICEQFSEKGILKDKTISNPYYYRLPIIMGEYPRHTKIINAAIREFNQLIEYYHQQLVKDPKLEIDAEKLNKLFSHVVSQVAQHGSYCFPESLTELVNMMQGYSCIKFDFIEDQPDPEKKKNNKTVSNYNSENTVVPQSDPIKNKQNQIASNKSESTAVSQPEPIKIKQNQIASNKSESTAVSQPEPIKIKQDLASNKIESTIIPPPAPIKNKKCEGASTKTAISAIQIIAAKEKNLPGLSKPFSEKSIYAINRAGRLASQSSKLVVNGFGLKFGGHFDGLLTHTPSLIQLSDFYAMLWRELSQQIELPSEESDDAIKLRVLLLTTLKTLGMVIESTTDMNDPSEYYISPFSTQPQAFLTPISIKKILSETASNQYFSITDDQLLTLSDYLSHILYRMQFNISTALGIGANDDDTVSFSNDGRDYIFQFDQQESEWASSFANISLHRQGPAQPHMNAAKGAKYELAAAFLTEAKKMSQLQRSEYNETIYNAIIDNLVAELFPNPDFFENSKYKKYRKQYILTKNSSHQTQLSSYAEESTTGIFKENGQTTPRFRRAGTIDIHALPKDHAGVSESLISFNSRNPLAAKQFQYAQAMQGGVRGDYIYNPIGEDGFISDIYNGQVIKNSDGSYTPFIGVIPKNFDKEFKQDTELCASFVVRMLHSSRLMTHCPTFRLNYNILKSSFLPNKASIPDLPPTFMDSGFLKNELQALKESLDQNSKDLSFHDSEKAFASLFKNVIYLLRKFGESDNHFSTFHHHLIKDPDFLKMMNRDNFEKIIRILKINAPIKNNVVNKDYLSTITYLEQLTQSFYPEPSIETAKKIQKYAKAYMQPLTVHNDIQSYFEQLRNNPQLNISRTQSPGMLFMKLRGDHSSKKQTLEQKYADFDRMHTKNFIAGHRDPEGSLVAKPSNVDEFIDWTAKGAGKLSAGLQHDSNPFGQVITAPFAGAYHTAKDTYAKTDSVIASVCATPLGLVAGTGEGGFKLLSYGLKFMLRPGIRAKDSISYCTSKIDTSTTKGKATIAALFIPAILHGLVSGIVESTGKLLYDCSIGPIYDFVDQYKDRSQKSDSIPAINEHPLYIPSTPDNEPGFKIKISDQSRDIILEADKKTILLKQLKTLVGQIITTAYPDFTNQEKEAAAEKFISSSILTKAQWDEFYSPFNQDGELGELLRKHKDKINSQFISAAYRCFLERESIKRDDLIKLTSTLYKLLPEQKPVLENLLNLYYEHPAEQEIYIHLFSEDGNLRKGLRNKDNHAQTLHDAVMQAFDLEKVKNAVYEANKTLNLFSKLTPKLTQDLIKKLPSHLFEQAKQSNKLEQEKKKIQDEISLVYKTIVELKSEIQELITDNTVENMSDLAEINSDIEKLNSAIKMSEEQLMNLEFLLNIGKAHESSDIKSKSMHNENEAILSIKDKAHLKWKHFATSELAHEYLSLNEQQAIFKIFLETELFQRSELIINKIMELQKCSITLMQLCNQDNIDKFYESYLNLKSSILSSTKNESRYHSLIHLLDDFVNVSMNRALNQTLDTINDKQSENPLNKSISIGRWLMYVYQSKDDFRSLLVQQLDQPFLHLAILRQGYIIHTLETSLKLSMNDERIHKTGLQKLLRIHYMESNSIKKNGEQHYEKKDIDDFEGYLKTHGVENSPTFHYANFRVKTKLGLFAGNGTVIKEPEAAPAEKMPSKSIMSTSG